MIRSLPKTPRASTDAKALPSRLRSWSGLYSLTCQGLRIGGGQDELAARTQYAVHFPHQFHVVFDVFDHLKGDDVIETARWQVERGNYGLPHLHVRERRPFARRFDFVEREKAGGVGGDYFDAVTRARTYFEYVAADSPRRLVIGQLRTLEYVVVRYVARYAFRREYFSHCARSVLHRSA